MEISNNKALWTTIVSKSDVPKSENAQILKFESVKARYIRVVGKKLRQSAVSKRYSMQIVEFEVFE